MADDSVLQEQGVIFQWPVVKDPSMFLEIAVKSVDIIMHKRVPATVH